MSKIHGLILALAGLASAAVSAAPKGSEALATVEAIGQRVRMELPTRMAYPLRASHHQLGGRVLLKVKLDDAGKVLSVQIKESSGSRELDHAAANFARRAHYAGSALATINLPIEFNPQQALAQN